MNACPPQLLARLQELNIAPPDPVTLESLLLRFQHGYWMVVVRAPARLDGHPSDCNIGIVPPSQAWQPLLHELQFFF